MATAKLKKQTQHITETLQILEQEYPHARCSLHFETPFQLLVATILSAQCTDERVNALTPKLFKQFPDPWAMAAVSPNELEPWIHSTGFFRSKAQALSAMSRAVVEKHQGVIPQTQKELMQLRGVGRKTANVVLGVAFGIPGIVVDTHVIRLSHRFGWVQSKDPWVIEQELMKEVPRKNWTQFGHWLIDHGRKVCIARRPRCEICVVAHLCSKKDVPVLKPKGKKL